MRTSSSRSNAHTATEPQPRSAGFTLIEMMATVAIIGLALTATYWGSRSLLPQTRLSSSASALGSALELARLHAVMVHEPLEFVYDMDRPGYESYYPYERDEKRNRRGPGRTPIQDFRSLEQGIRIRAVRIPGSPDRTSERVVLAISPLGHVVPHEVVIENPDHPETEVLTVRVDALAIRYEINEGSHAPLELEDADFR